MFMRSILSPGLLCALAVCWTASDCVWAVPGDAPASGSPSTVGTRTLRPRTLAPGVITIVAPEREETETFSGPRELVEIVHGIPSLKWKPNLSPQSETLLEQARETIFRRNVWHLEFSFKPLRMISVDLPQPSGKMQRKLIWYMVYKVKNTGSHFAPAAQPDKWGHETYGTQQLDFSTRFFPHFVLEAHEYKKAYLDRVIPLAAKAIQQREDPAIRLHNSVEIGKVSIPVSESGVDRSVWGVATWEDVDPKTDYFSVYIKGLTNAYRFEDPEGAFNQGDPPTTGRTFTFKTLQLNFWRPGDDLHEHEDEIRFGLPVLGDKKLEKEMLDKYRLEKRVDHRWIYR